MSSSFIAKSLQSSAYKGREPITTSPLRKYSSSTASSSQRDIETAATRRLPIRKTESLSRYDVGPSSRKNTKRLRENTSPSPPSMKATPKAIDGLPTRRLSGVILSPNQLSPSRRLSVTKSDLVTSPVQNSQSRPNSYEGLQAARQINSSAKFQDSPYSGLGLNEKIISPPQRRPSFGDSLQNISRSPAKPDLSLSPLVPTLSTSPIVGFLGPQQDLADDTSPSTSAMALERQDDQDKPYFSPQKSPQPLQSQQDLEREDFPRGMMSKPTTPGTSPPSPYSAFQSPRGAEGMSSTTNQPYDNVSSLESTMSPLGSHMNDGLTLVHELSPTDGSTGKSIMTPEEQVREDSLAKEAQKRRMKVRETMERVRSRLSQISHETKKMKRQYGARCCGPLCTCIFKMQQKLCRGKGPNLLILWVDSLTTIENNYGSSMMLVFAFLRWVFLMNSILAILWIFVIIVPFMVRPPETFSWMTFFKTLINKEDLKGIVQGESLDKTFVYYGGYMYQRWEQEGRYRVDYMYAVMIGITFFISYLAALWRIAERIIDVGHIAWGSQFFPFTSIVISSWDYHITSVQAASKLRKGIRMHLKEMLADANFKNANAINKRHGMSFKRFLALFILWPSVLAGNVLAVEELVKKADHINQLIGSQYAQTLFLSVLNSAMPVVVRMLVGIEAFRPAIAEKVILTKLFVVRIFSMGTFFYRLYMMVRDTNAVRNGVDPIQACGAKSTCSQGFTCCTSVGMTDWDICTQNDINFCLPGCTENEVGAQLLRLITITTLLRVVCELGYGFGYVWTSSGKKRQFLIEDMAIDIVYIQALIWVGVCFSPMAAVTGFFSNLITWYSMTFALFKTCAPVEKAYSASRTSTITYGLLLFTLVLCTIPAFYTLLQNSSGFCGPIPQNKSMYSVLSGYIQEAPSGLWMALSWLFNPAVLVGVILLLVFVIVVGQSQLTQARQFLALTKYEMGARQREAGSRIRRVRQTLMQGSIYYGALFPNEGQSLMSELPTSREASIPQSPLLPGQVDPGKTPNSFLESHKDR